MVVVHSVGFAFASCEVSCGDWIERNQPGVSRLLTHSKEHRAAARLERRLNATEVIGMSVAKDHLVGVGEVDAQ